MNTIGIVALSLLLGAFIVCLIAMAGYLAWDGHRLRKLLDSTCAACLSAQQSLGLIHADIRSTLETHHQRMEAAVAKINADKLADAATGAIQAARRIEAAAVALGDLARALLSEDALSQVRDTGLEPEAYAPAAPGEHYVSLNRTAAQDRAELAGEGEEPTER